MQSQTPEMTTGRRVLLCAIGMSPQIVTETLYALAVKPDAGREPWVPTEIHLVTTARGAANARLNLLSGDPGWFHQLRRDYALPQIAFGSESIHVIQDANGRGLDDIRTPADNEAAADQIAELVRSLSEGDRVQLHASLAGGRKTMGYYLGYAMSLFGRPQDRLSHVLVSEPFEGHPDFYYPTPTERVIHTRAPLPPQAMNCADALVQLAEIPFVRLRDGLPERLRTGRCAFTESVDAANRALGPARVRLQLQSWRLQANETEVALSGVAFALYAWLARRVLEDRPEVVWSSVEDAEDFMQSSRALLGEASAEFERIEDALRARLAQRDGKALAEYFQPLTSRDVNGVLRKTLGEAQAQRFAVLNVGSRGNARYRLPPDVQIELIDQE